MSEKAIRVQGLGKEYQIGKRERGYTTFREALSRTVTAPFRRLRKLSGGTDPEGSFWALKNVSFDVEPGEVVGIIGRNGAGKSTLLKILSQITEPTTGEITLNGRVGSLLEVGTGFHPELTGRENIFLNGAILGMSRREVTQKFDEIVAFSEVDKFLDTPVKRYSSGMYTRLAFSVAAHLEPEILIVDEVLAVGDAQFQQKCIGKMQDVARGGRTVLFVSHNMAAVEGLCDRGVVLEGGRVSFCGSALAATQYYGHNTPSSTIYTSHMNGACIRRAEVIGEAMVPGCLAPGESFEVITDFMAQEPLHSLELGIGIDNSHGARVLTCHTRCDPQWQNSSVSGHFRMTCRVQDLALAPGSYTVKLSLESAGHLVEVIPHAFAFKVVPADFYRCGGRQFSGVVYCPQQWTLTELLANSSTRAE